MASLCEGLLADSVRKGLGLGGFRGLRVLLCGAVDLKFPRTL